MSLPPVLERLTKATKLYNDSWNLESGSSLKNLQTAATLLEKGLSFDPTNSEIIKYTQLTKCKLLGDESLRRARTCRRQAAEAFTQRDFTFSYARYGDAIQDCCMAITHFEDGLKIMDDEQQESRFENSLASIQDELGLVLEGRDEVRPFKEAEEKRREAERPLRKKMEEEKKREKFIEDMEKEQRRRRFARGFLGTGATIGTLGLLAHGGGPSSHDGGGDYSSSSGHVDYGGQRQLDGSADTELLMAATDLVTDMD